MFDGLFARFHPPRFDRFYPSFLQSLVDFFPPSGFIIRGQTRFLRNDYLLLHANGIRPVLNWMFSEEEIAALCNVPRVIVGRVAAAPDSPFFLSKCRPEWFVEWMRRHADFGLSEGTHPKNIRKSVPQSPSSPNPWADARRFSGGQRER